MSNKHTPGPWIHSGKIAGDIVDANGVLVCTVAGSIVTAERDDANQAIIAAAPDMLAALMGLEIAASGAGVPHPQERKLLHEQIFAARAAIAKAEGR